MKRLGNARGFLAVVLGLCFGPGIGLAHDGFVRLPGTDVVEPVGVWAKKHGGPGRTNSIFRGDCRSRVAETVCLVDSSKGKDAWDRTCLPESKRYVPVFEALYDRFPPLLQNMFCSLEKLYVEKDLDSTAYALRGSAVIGIRASLIDDNLSLPAWSTWKEQLSFGGSLTSYQVRDDLPTFQSEGDAGENNMLYSIIAHEFGHLFDFANDLNAMEGFGFRAGSWGDLSWASVSTPKDGNNYRHRDGMCFYNCSDFLKREDVTDLYDDLFTRTNFLNTYTARNAYEDWADTFSFYLLFKNVNVTYQLDTRQGKVYDFKRELASPRMAEKVRYIETFLGRSDIRYPQ